MTFIRKEVFTPTDHLLHGKLHNYVFFHMVPIKQRHVQVHQEFIETLFDHFMKTYGQRYVQGRAKRLQTLSNDIELKSGI